MPKEGPRWTTAKRKQQGKEGSGLEGSREGDRSRGPGKKSLQSGRPPEAVILEDLGGVAKRANIEQNYI